MWQLPKDNPKGNPLHMKSPDVRFLAWSIFALALSLPATAWVWSHGERPVSASAQTIVLPAPVAPIPLQQAAPVPEGALDDGIPIDFMDAVAFTRNDGAEVKYTVNRNAQVWVDVLASNGTVVRSLGNKAVESGVGESAFWDGTSEGGKIAPLDHYKMRIRANAGGRMAQIEKPITLPTLFELPKTR